MDHHMSESVVGFKGMFSVCEIVLLQQIFFLCVSQTIQRS